ncbi:hypothetical protein ACHAWU_003278 [Discostella pseudostelligera]|uniref:Uncharacterized protein n=1 Tax=Discostella pseudostelligera TaxID=259834 RepID=A0ABD3MU58_9STRA
MIMYLNPLVAMMCLSLSASAAPPPPAGYHNLSLHSPLMSATVFMPLESSSGSSAAIPANEIYYLGSRFEHGSMIGDIFFGHDRSVYGRSLWRTPHDPTWPESGVGLASEFGCGDNGATCAGRGDITNGVLGYESAKVGEPFLKIGVGALIKGSCSECTTDGTPNNNNNGDSSSYRFNSPYKFYRPPSWKILPSPDPNEVTFVSEEIVGDYGYRIQKTIRLDGNVLTVRSLLTNLGTKQFTTPWYSHHFFTGDVDPIGPGYVLDLGLSEYGVPKGTPAFKQPGLGSWSGDMNEYANVTMASDGSISMSVKKLIPDGVKLKADFLDENTQTLTDGSFTLHAPNGLSVYERIPELQTQSGNPFIYAYSVYAERGALSPEPMLLLYVRPGETTFWTQHLRFTSTSDKKTSGGSSSLAFLSMLMAEAMERIPWDFNSSSSSTSGGCAFLLFVVVSFGVILVANSTTTRITAGWWWRSSSLSPSTTRRYNHQYTPIPDNDEDRLERSDAV